MNIKTYIKKRILGDRKVLKRIFLFACSFLIPALVLVLIWGSQGITYHGKVTLLSYDMDAQYMQFLYSLRYLIKNPSEILFNWNFGYGGNYTGIMSYYLMSPLNLITLFWDLESFPDAIYCLMLLKISLCGVSFFGLITYFEKDTKPFGLLFSTCYALMSYNIAYGMCVMWMDAVIIFPIVIIGIEMLLSKKRGIIYFVSITYIFITSYYMAYFVGVFSVIYLSVRVISNCDKYSIKERIIVLCRFTINSVLGLGLSMPIILPSLLCISKFNRSGFEKGIIDAFYKCNIIEKLKMLIPSQYCTLSLGGQPYVFCGLGMFVLALIYFLQKHNWKEKLCSAIMIIAVSIGFFVMQADYVWHGFRYPTGFNYRYSFLFSFLIILLAYKAFVRLYSEKYHLIFGILSLYTISELFMNGTAIISGIQQEFNYQNYSGYNRNTSLYKPLVEHINEDDSFFRVGNTRYILGYNQCLLFNLKGTDLFSSVNQKKVTTFLRSMGAIDTRSDLVLLSEGLVPNIKSILGIKYTISPSDYNGMETLIGQSSYGDLKLSLLENKNAVGLGFLIDKKDDYSFEYVNDPFINQEEACDILGINENIFTKVPHDAEWQKKDNDSDEINIYFEIEEDKPVYFYTDMLYKMSVDYKFYLDEELIYETKDIRTRSVIVLNNLEVGKRYTLRVLGDYNYFNRMYMYQFDESAYQNQMEKLLMKDMLNVTKSNGNRICGNINANKDGSLYISLPYDTGYRIYIDGKRVDYYEMLNAFIGVDIPKGMHTIEILYIPQGLFAGLLLMFASVFMAFTFYYVEYKKQNN